MEPFELGTAEQLSPPQAVIEIMNDNKTPPLMAAKMYGSVPHVPENAPSENVELRNYPACDPRAEIDKLRAELEKAREEIRYLKSPSPGMKAPEPITVEAEKWRGKVAALEEQLEQAQRDRCPDCGAKLYYGPPPCPWCGAPNCCPQCCKINTLETELKQAQRERDAAIDLSRQYMNQITEHITGTPKDDLQQQLTRARAELAACEKERDGLREALRRLLLSADASWMTGGQGHDWSEAVKEAEKLI